MARIVLFAVIGLALSLTGKASADSAPLTPPPQLSKQPAVLDSVTVKIEVDVDAKGPRLVVPNGVFTAPRGKGPQGALERENTDGVAENNNSGQPRNHFLIAGIAIALSMAFGGLWLRRKSGKFAIRGLALLIVAGAMLTAGAVDWANGTPPPAKNRPPATKKGAQPLPDQLGEVEAYPSAYEGTASVVLVNSQEPVRLILDKDSYEKLKKGKLKAVPAKPN